MSDIPDKCVVIQRDQSRLEKQGQEESHEEMVNLVWILLLLSIINYGYIKKTSICIVPNFLLRMVHSLCLICITWHSTVSQFWHLILVKLTSFYGSYEALPIFNLVSHRSLIFYLFLINTPLYIYSTIGVNVRQWELVYKDWHCQLCVCKRENHPPQICPKLTWRVCAAAKYLCLLEILSFIHYNKGTEIPYVLGVYFFSRFQVASTKCREHYENQEKHTSTTGKDKLKMIFVFLLCWILYSNK